MHWRAYQRLQRVVGLGDRFVSYVDEGEGEPIVFLHGIPTWGYLWSRFYKAFAVGHRVLVPDLLGYGFSDRRDGFDRSISRQAEHLEGWLDRLGLSEVTLVGHDLGGGVALHMATRFAGRVKRLCLMASVSYDSFPIGSLHQLGSPQSDRRLHAAALRRAVELLMGRGFAAAPPEGFVEGLLAPYSTEVGKLSLIRDAASLDASETLELVPRLGKIGVPTLILWGEDDPFQPLKYGERLAWDIPGAQLVRVMGARHFLMLDQPNQVANGLFQLLGERPLPEPIPIVEVTAPA